MTRFVGLDISQKFSYICVTDENGNRLWRGICPTSPDEIAKSIELHGGPAPIVGLESGAMSPWLIHGLRSRGINAICIDARHARAALSMQLNKNDHNDAEGLAQIMRTGWYRPVHVKSFDTHRARALLRSRLQLIEMVTRLSNHIRGLLKTFGLLPGGIRGKKFAERVEVLVADRPDIAPIILPMLAAWSRLREQIAIFDKAIREEAKESPVCRLLMSVPGIGPITVLAYVTAIEDPSRFRRSRLVGAHLGLTPRQYQSGEFDRNSRTSKCGDVLARVCLYEAATVIMTRLQRPVPLKDWAQKIARRSGIKKARVALARKLAVILHSIWRSGEPFRWDTANM